jgi:hypothetical protein
MTISLEENEIGAEGARHIADALKINKTLTTLYLSGECTNCVCNTFVCMPTPDLCSYEDNYIGVEGARLIADALKVNVALTAVDLRCEFTY